MSGMHMTSIPAEYAACIPASLSSKTRQFFGGSLAHSQALIKISGYGLPLFTSIPKIISSKKAEIPFLPRTSMARSIVLEDARSILYCRRFK